VTKTIALGLFILAMATPAWAQATKSTFQLTANPAFVQCLQASPNKTPSATCIVDETAAARPLLS
jgi:hypothetical protein